MPSDTTVPQKLAFPARTLAALSSGKWLNRRRLTAYAWILFVSEIVTFAFFVLGTHGVFDHLMNIPPGPPTTTDFVSFYSAGALAAAGMPALAYDRAAHYLAEQQAIHQVGFAYNYFFYPPVFLLICRWLARLPYLVAFVLFETATGAAFLLIVRKIVGRPGLMMPFIAYPSLFWTVGLGQNALLTAALFGGATYCVQRRPLLAGVLFGCLCYKPHLGLLIPVALLAGRHWRCFFAASATVVGLVLVSWWVDGPAAWHAFLAVTGSARGTFQDSGVPPSGLVTPFAAMRVLGFSPIVSEIVQLFFTAGAVLAVGWAWWPRPAGAEVSLAVRAAVLAAATLLALPVLLFYDWMLAAIAMAWLVRAASRDGYRAWEKLGMLLVGFGPICSRGFALTYHVPFMPLLGLLLLGLTLARLRPAAVEAW